MIIEEIKLNNFRNYDSLSLSVEPGINVIYGKNGYGKTNILEAMFLCCIGKSFRTNHDTEMIKNGKDDFEVSLKIGDNLFGKIIINYNRKKEKVVRVDGVCIEKLRFLMGKLNGILFSPETLSLITSGPAERRRFMDVALCQMSGNYFYAISTYNKYVNEKTALLTNKKVVPDETMLSVLNENISKLASEVIVGRAVFMKKIAAYAAEYYSKISAEQELIDIKYTVSCPAAQRYLKETENPVCEEVEKLILEELNSEKNRERELAYGKCFVGPHRDDFDCLLDGQSLRSFGSQGQKRSAVISMKLAELEIMKETSGRVPILFLDDVLSELDRDRKNKILELTKNYQTFITCTDRDIAEDITEADGRVRTRVNYINVEFLR